jgi:hypothetical protein
MTKPTWHLQHGAPMQTWGLWLGATQIATVVAGRDGWAVWVRGFWLASTLYTHKQAMRVAETVAGCVQEVADEP